MKIIVARYKEDVSWTKKFKNVVIFNKGDPLNDKDYEEYFLKNVGREGHTFFKYIYDNYDNLDDYTVFLQGNPYDHCDQLDEKIHLFTNNMSSDFEFLIGGNYPKLLTCNLNGCPHHDGLPLRETYKKIFTDDKPEPQEIIFGAGAQFIVSKNKILSKPRDHYLKVVQLLENDISPIECWVIERFTKLIFD